MTGPAPLPRPTLSGTELRALVTETLHPDAALAARKVFTRRDVLVATAPLYGRDPSQLTRVVDRTLADPEAVPLLGVAGVWQGTRVGKAAKAWSAAYTEWQSCLSRAETAGWREAAALRHRAAKAAKVEPALRDRFDALAAPERARLKTELPKARRVLDELGSRSSAHLLFSHQAPRSPAETGAPRRPDRHRGLRA